MSTIDRLNLTFLIEFTSTLEIGTSRQPITVSNATVLMSLNKEGMQDNVAYGVTKMKSLGNLLNAYEDKNDDILLKEMEFQNKVFICFTSKEEGK